MSGEAPTTSPPNGLEDELLALARAHAAVIDALRRMFNAIASGPDALVGIERLRLENCVDLYRNCAGGIQAAFEVCASRPADRAGSDESDHSDHSGADDLLLVHGCLGDDRTGGGGGHGGVSGRRIALQQTHSRFAEAQSRSSAAE